VKVWHWSHVGTKKCDQWWETETQWHRDWKEKFPSEWHEVGHRALNGERHVADVKTSNGLVLEFQHSPISDAERTARTNFYGNMIWLVDGARLEKNRSNFARSILSWKRWDHRTLGHTFAEGTFPNEWINCQVPIFFDFGEKIFEGDEETDHILWCLLPRHSIAPRLVVMISKIDFISRTLDRHPLPEWRKLSDQFVAMREEERQVAVQKSLARMRHTRWER
jgi:hypothetical protein